MFGGSDILLELVRRHPEKFSPKIVRCVRNADELAPLLAYPFFILAWLIWAIATDIDMDKFRLIFGI